jgi:hypothetical protein
MNAIAAPLLWGIGQVTVVALVTVFLYLLASRSGPRSRAAIAVSGLLASAVLSVLALSPWPCWEPRHVPAAAGASVPSTSPATPTQAPDPSK